MIPAGSLQERVTFRRKTESLAASGAALEAWADLFICRAEVREPSTDEVAIGFGEIERESVVIVIRWHPISVALDDRVIFDGRAFDIQQITEIGRRIGWKISAVAAS